MGKRSNQQIVGTRIGLYDVLYECDFKSNDGHRMFHIKCSECGWETDTRMNEIKRLSKKCTHVNLFGVYTYDRINNIQNTNLNKIFRGMYCRCYDVKEKSYRWYGAKGVKICQEWINNPKSFEEWALANGYENNLTIDRIEEDKDYCPDNCRWITRKDNARYKSTTTLLTVNDTTHTGREWASILGVGTNVINTMLRNHPKEQVIEFVQKRLNNPSLKRKGSLSWFQLYEIK